MATPATGYSVLEGATQRIGIHTHTQGKIVTYSVKVKWRLSWPLNPQHNTLAVHKTNIKSAPTMLNFSQQDIIVIHLGRAHFVNRVSRKLGTGAQSTWRRTQDLPAVRVP